ALVSACCILVFAAEVRRASEKSHPTIQQHSATTEENENAKLTLYTYWLTFFTAVLALATIGLGGATIGLYFAGERQLKLAKETSDRQAAQIQSQIGLAREDFLSTHRPKLRFKHVWLLSEFKEGVPTVGQVTCINSGPSDAVIVEYGMKFFIIERGKS